MLSIINLVMQPSGVCFVSETFYKSIFSLEGEKGTVIVHGDDLNR